MYVLGLSFFYHNSAACLLLDGIIVAAAEEERFTRKKNDPDFPKNAVEFCLDSAGISIDEVEYVSFYEKPFLKLERMILSAIENWPKGILQFPRAITSGIEKNSKISSVIRSETGFVGDVLFVKHHAAHAASAFFTSGFAESAIVTVDGAGEWDTTTVSVGEGNSVRMLEAIAFPDSLGLFYSAFTQYLWFEVNEGEYKLMGAAPYGTPRYVEAIFEHILTLHPDGSYSLNRDFFKYEYADSMISHKQFQKLFGIPARKAEEPMEPVHFDIAASVQKVFEEVLLAICRHAKKITKKSSVCLAGGSALNCVANSRLLLEGIFSDAWVFPAAWDAGWSVGAALHTWYHVLGNPRVAPAAISHVFWGPEWNDAEIAEYLDRTGISYEAYGETELFAQVSECLRSQKVVGWFQGRMEFWPRSLWNRAILADARNADNWQRVNRKIKFRESFRPFAPSILADHVAEYFDFPKESPFMLFTAQVKNATLPATTHVDGSSRIQTVSEKENGRYYGLLRQFLKDTGCPAVINTSFNTSGMPIVCSPQNAYQCFLRTEMDVLVLGNCVIWKEISPSRKRS